VLSAILAFSLLWQYAVVATVQVALCCQAAPASAENGDETICRCVHAPDTVCPMHTSSTTPESGRAAQPRWCAGCTEQTAVLSIGVSGDTGTPPREPFRAVTPPQLTTIIADATAPPLDANRPPFLPPPRG
jgi:hypothetical protein